MLDTFFDNLSLNTLYLLTTSCVTRFDIVIIKQSSILFMQQTYECAQIVVYTFTHSTSSSNSNLRSCTEHNKPKCQAKSPNHLLHNKIYHVKNVVAINHVSNINLQSMVMVRNNYQLVYNFVHVINVIHYQHKTHSQLSTQIDSTTPKDSPYK